MEVATHQMEHCATPGISGTSEGQFGLREVPATIAKQSSGSIVMPPPSFPVDLSTPIRREAELESMSCQVPPSATQRFGAEAISTNERLQHGLHAGGMMTEMDWEHTATVNRPATSQQVPVGSGPESAQCMPGRRMETPVKGTPRRRPELWNEGQYQRHFRDRDQLRITPDRYDGRGHNSIT